MALSLHGPGLPTLFMATWDPEGQAQCWARRASSVSLVTGLMSKLVFVLRAQFAPSQ